VTGRTATCPNCGAPVVFLWSAAVQTTCEYCRSVLVRHDVELERVGVAADVPQDSSPVQRGTVGTWRGRGFTVVGRIVYAYERGGWNEWHLRFTDGGGGWLSDAQLEYAVTELVTPPSELPQRFQLTPGREVDVAGERFTVTTVTEAHYATVEGELPFEYWDKGDVTFVDLRTPGARFATIDYTESPPLVFVGEFVDFDALGMQGLREFEGWPPPR
jgi:hypothetical protein